MTKRRSALPCLLLLFPLLVSCGGIQQNVINPGQVGGGGGTGGDNHFANLDDSNPSQWNICVMGACAGDGTPGGNHPPASYSFTTGETDHSCDGYSALLTETSANVEGNASSNILATFKAGSEDDMNSFTSGYCFYLTGTIDEAEFDTFQFNATKNAEFMFGTQCVAGKSWDIWNQKTGGWISLGSSVPCSLSFDTYHKMTQTLHWDPSDSGDCDGQICMYFDSIVLDGTTLCSPCGSPQPSGELPKGWSSNSGFQFQVDITAPNKTGSMYIDLADFTASQ